MYVQLRSECKKQGAIIKGTHMFWIFARKNGQHNDFYIESHNKVYSIKLFSLKNNRLVLVLDGKGNYFIRKRLALIGNTGAVAIMSNDTKRKELPSYDFKKRFQDEWYIKELTPLILVHPCRNDIWCMASADHCRPIDARETFNGMMIMRLSDLLRQQL